jgi:predicted lipoprotein with Yx(FWY)xxD motif
MNRIAVHGVSWAAADSRGIREGDTMNKRAALFLAAASAASALTLAGCGGGSGSTGSSSAPAAAPASSSAPASSASAEVETLKTATVAGHTVVVDGEGKAVYVYTRDNPGTTASACTGGCASLWPAVTSASAPTLQGVTGKIGSITGVNGKQQITVNGMPIYYYAKDTAPGQFNGQGVANVWYVIGADGSMIQTPLASTAASTSGY